MEKKRLAILAMFSNDGLIYDYQKYLLSELKKEIDDIYIVCNSDKKDKVFSEDTKKELLNYAKHIYFRYNEGYDSTAIKEVLEVYLGWEYVREYDELVLLNDSFFGPFDSFKNIFANMELRECDFWSFTANNKSNEKMGVVPFHLQSYFYVIRKNMLISGHFKEFWDSLLQIKTYKEAVVNYELRFTDFFISRGFVADTYINYDGIFSDCFEENYVSTMIDPATIVIDKGCPIIKKKCFMMDRKETGYVSCGEDVVRVLRYLKESDKYNVDYIWQFLIKSRKLEELDCVLNLDYITNECCEIKSLQLFSEAVIVLYVTSDIFAEDMKYYLAALNRCVEVVVAADSRLKAKITDIAEYVSAIIMVDEDKDAVEVLYGITKKFWQEKKYVCYLNDIDTYIPGEVLKKARSNNYNRLENLLHNKQSVYDILMKLASESYLGAFLVDDVFGNAIIKKSCFGETFSFWSKVDVLMEVEKVMNIHTFEDKKDISRYFYRYIQRAGYYCMRVMSSDYARLRINYLNSLNKKMNIFTNVQNEHELDKKTEEKRVLEYCKDKCKIYVFGNGIKGKLCSEILIKNNIKLDGYIVSRRNADDSSKIPVFELEEVDFNENDIGIIIAITSADAIDINKRFIDKGYSQALIIGI